MERRRVDTLVVGAGPTGLGAAWRLSALGDRDWCLCEASAAFGGLAGSIVDADGFTWDFGGHVQHSHYGYFDELMDDLLGREGWISHRRESWIWIADRFVPYPFQLNLHRLPAVVFDECLDGLRAAAAGVAGTGDAPRNFAQWIDATFGRGIARHFMRPYNLKVWACPLEDMDWRWTGDRVAVVDRTRAFKGEAEADARDDTSWGPNREFRFPLRGGTGAVWTTLGERLQRRHPESILMTRTLTGVDSGRRLAYFDNGLTIEFGRLLTTMPLGRVRRPERSERTPGPCRHRPALHDDACGRRRTARRPARIALDEVLDVLPGSRLPVLPRHRVLPLFAAQRPGRRSVLVADGRSVAARAAARPTTGWWSARCRALSIPASSPRARRCITSGTAGWNEDTRCRRSAGTPRCAKF